MVLSADESKSYDGFRRNKYDFLPNRDEISFKNVPGEWISCKVKKSQWFFDNFNFSWNCFAYDLPDHYNVIAVNKVGDIVSFSTPIQNGYCVFLPTVEYSQRGMLVDSLIQRYENLVNIEKGTTEIPDWINNYTTKNEKELLSQKSEIERKLGKTVRLKPLLYETGKKLEQIVYDTIKNLGIDIRKLPEGSYADYEFPLNKQLTAICEIKGLRGSANIDDLRQLLQYYIEQRDIEGRSVKGVLIVNHFRDIIPNRRGIPLTKDATNLTKKHDFTVITTVDLYNFLVKDIDASNLKNRFLKEFFSNNLS